MSLLNNLPEDKNKQELLVQVKELLADNNFGNELECDNDPIFINTVSDSYEILRNLIYLGENEDNKLFQRQVLFSFTDSDYIQAIAKVIGEYDVVFMTKGLINKIRRTICKLLTHPNTFEGIGHSNRENITVQSDADITILPNCPERLEFINGVIQRAIEFVFIHELAHIFYGHHAYIMKSDKIVNNYLFLMSQPKDIDSQKFEMHNIELKSDRHAMEIQADRYAADVTLMLAFKEIWSNRYIYGSCSEFLQKKLEIRTLQEWGTALNIIFNIIESISSNFHTHPRPKLRSLASMTSAIVVWMSTSRDKAKNIHTNLEEFQRIFNDMRLEVNNAWKIVGLPVIIPDSNFDEKEFRGLMDRAIYLFPRLESRFPGDRVI